MRIGAALNGPELIWPINSAIVTLPFKCACDVRLGAYPSGPEVRDQCMMLAHMLQGLKAKSRGRFGPSFKVREFAKSVGLRGLLAPPRLG